MAQAPAFDGLLVGTSRLHRRGGFGFPQYELRNGGRRVAALGRDSSLNIMLGRGRKVVLENGVEWRIKAATSGPYIVPVVKSAGGTVARSGLRGGHRVYGIDGLDFAYTVFPLNRAGLLHSQHWGIRVRNVDVGRIDQGAGIVDSTEPIPIAAVLLAFTLIEHGIPGEARLRPTLD